MSALLHPGTAAQIDTLRQHPTGSVIFSGPRGLGKATVARELAATLNCLGDVAGKCVNCRQIEAGNFPDLILVERAEKPSLTIEQVRGLTSELALRPFAHGGVRVVLIDQANLLTPEAQNALLKLLEEPPARTLIILVAEHPEILLLTVRSRCQVVRFIRPGEAAVADLLTGTHGIPGPAAATIATLSAGAPGTAITLAANPAEAEALTSLTTDAAGTAWHSLFQRLLLAARLASTGTDLDRFGEALHRSILARLQAAELDPDSASLSLGALERFRLQLRAKVSPRVALERLMLEIS